MRRSLLLIPGMLSCAFPAMAASSASLQGLVTDTKGQPVAGARVLLRNPLSAYRLSTVTDKQGRYAIPNVPFHEYHLEVAAPGTNVFHRDLELRSSLPLRVNVVLQEAGATVEVCDRLSLLEEHPAVHLDIDKSAIELALAPVQSRALESILLATPGFAANDNGRFHFRGSHGQMTYVIDGVPLSDHTHASFSNSLDPAQVESLEVVTGGISAEFGGKPVAVVSMTTRSGLGTPGGFEGEVSAGAASQGAREMGVQVRGGSGDFGYFVTGAGSRSDRFLDPVNIENLHNHGQTGRLFSRFDWVLGPRDTLRFSASGGRTRRDVVNLASQEARGQDQGVETGDSNLSLSWAHLLGEDRSLEFALYHRRGTSLLHPSSELETGFAEGGLDQPVWARQERSLANRGILASFHQRYTGGSSLKAGLQYVDFPIHEDFRFAVTRSGWIEPGSGFHPYTPEGGGSIWHFQDRIRPSLASAFIQNDLHLGRVFLALGLRYDRWVLRGESEDELQPRLGLSWKLGDSTVLRASYDRLLITPDRENLALSSSELVAELGEEPGSEAVHVFHQVRPELQDSWTLGVEQQLGTWGRVSAEYWERKGRNTADVEQFMNTGVEFPIAMAHGFFHGFNVRFEAAPTQATTAYLSFGKTRALVEGPMAGGLHLHGEEAEQSTGRFPIDHDQKLSGQAGLRWRREGWHLHGECRYDSGLVAGDPGEAIGDPDLEFGLAHIRYDAGDGVWRVKPRTLWNVGGGREFQLGTRKSLMLSADILNLADTRTLYNFLSHRGGTHVYPGRTVSFRIRYRF
jgi:outer membrane receptor protein involved in Fe transport